MYLFYIVFLPTSRSHKKRKTTPWYMFKYGKFIDLIYLLNKKTTFFSHTRVGQYQTEM